jgi:hypothetical protein
VAVPFLMFLPQHDPSWRRVLVVDDPVAAFGK